MERSFVVDFTPRPGPYIKDQFKKKKKIIKISKIKKKKKSQVYTQYNLNNIKYYTLKKGRKYDKSFIVFIFDG